MGWASGRNASHSGLFVTPVLKLKLIHSFTDTANIHYLWCARLCVITTLPVIAEQSLSSLMTPVSVFGAFPPRGLPLHTSGWTVPPLCELHTPLPPGCFSDPPDSTSLPRSISRDFSYRSLLFLFRYNWHSLLILNNLHTNLWFGVRELHERFCLWAYHWIVVSGAALTALHI